MDTVCRVRIVTETGGERRVFTGFGTLSFGAEDFSVRYGDGQDSISLSYKDGDFFMDRRGETNLSARFCLDEETEMQIFLGDMRGALPIRTHILKKTQCSDKILFSLDYFLGAGEQQTPFSLQMEFIFSEES